MVMRAADGEARMAALMACPEFAEWLA
jgi:hypothetical protein